MTSITFPITADEMMFEEVASTSPCDRKSGLVGGYQNWRFSKMIGLGP